MIEAPFELCVQRENSVVLRPLARCIRRMDMLCTGVDGQCARIQMVSFITTCNSVADSLSTDTWEQQCKMVFRKWSLCEVVSIAPPPNLHRSHMFFACGKSWDLALVGAMRNSTTAAVFGVHGTVLQVGIPIKHSATLESHMTMLCNFGRFPFFVFPSVTGVSARIRHLG